MCGYCVPTFDHHCIWLNQCVGENNYKYFLLFLMTNFVFFFYAAYTLGLIMLSEVCSCGHFDTCVSQYLHINFILGIWKKSICCCLHRSLDRNGKEFIVLMSCKHIDIILFCLGIPSFLFSDRNIYSDEIYPNFYSFCVGFGHGNRYLVSLYGDEKKCFHWRYTVVFIGASFYIMSIW